MEPSPLIHWRLCHPKWDFGASSLHHSQGCAAAAAPEPTPAMALSPAGRQGNPVQVAASNYREGFFPGCLISAGGQRGAIRAKAASAWSGRQAAAKAIRQQWSGELTALDWRSPARSESGAGDMLTSWLHPHHHRGAGRTAERGGHDPASPHPAALQCYCAFVSPRKPSQGPQHFAKPVNETKFES